MFEWVIQSVKLFLPKLKTDLVEVLEACCDKKLASVNIEWINKKSLCVVLCSKGYPDTIKKIS